MKNKYSIFGKSVLVRDILRVSWDVLAVLAVLAAAAWIGGK